MSELLPKAQLGTSDGVRTTANSSGSTSDGVRTTAEGADGHL